MVQLQTPRNSLYTVYQFSSYHTIFFHFASMMVGHILHFMLLHGDKFNMESLGSWQARQLINQLLVSDVRWCGLPLACVLQGYYDHSHLHFTPVTSYVYIVYQYPCQFSSMNSKGSGSITEYRFLFKNYFSYFKEQYLFFTSFNTRKWITGQTAETLQYRSLLVSSVGFQSL